MKRVFAMLLALSLLLSLAACGVPTPPVSDDLPTAAPAEDSVEEPEEIPAALEKLNKSVADHVKEKIPAITAEYERVIANIDSYDKYLENIDQVGVFYSDVLAKVRALGIELREYGVEYAETILASDRTNYEKYDDFDEMFDSLYDGAGGKMYDEIYDKMFGDVYDNLYDEIISNAYEDVPYEEWSDTSSAEYDRLTEARSAVYEECTNFRSDVYEFWSDIKSDVWDDDLEKAKERVADFQEGIERIKSGETQSDEDSEDEEVEDPSGEEPEGTPSAEKPEEEKSDEELVDGMRPEFKAAMDSYEQFYDEYCEFMKQYKANPTDLKLLAEYTDMLKRLAEMNEAFSAWDEGEMNTEEMKYYLDVSNRVAQKLLEVAD